MPLTPEIIIEDVKKVYAECLARDHERAHSLEDALHQRVLEAIANGGCEDPRACASAALRTLGMDFERWCA